MEGLNFYLSVPLLLLYRLCLHPSWDSRLPVGFFVELPGMMTGMSCVMVALLAHK